MALLVPIEAVPALSRRYRAAQTARAVAYEAPWSEAILRVLTSTASAVLPAHRAGFIADLLGISKRDEASRCCGEPAPSIGTADATAFWMQLRSTREAIETG